MRKSLVLFFILLLFRGAFAQDIDYARSLIDSLASLHFHGRGYVHNGSYIAAEFIRKNLKEANAKPLVKDYFQSLFFPINTFPGKVKMKVGDKELVPAVDYFISASSPSIKGSYKTLFLNETTLANAKAKAKFDKADYSNLILVVDTGFKDLKNPKLATAKCVVYIWDKPMIWSIYGAQVQNNYVQINVARGALPAKFKTITFDIEAIFHPMYETQNVAGFVSGKTCPDTFIVFTAHYDHLGEMGEDIIFPGANDNAAGVAMTLDLARYYARSENQPYYSVAFLFFTGEEVAILGSKYYTEFPLFPLANIKMLINLDVIGTGSDGLMVVNGTVHTDEFDQLCKINDEKQYVKRIAKKGATTVSDHYYFNSKGVKTIFIFTLGKEYKEYHNLYDKADVLPLTEYEDLYRLLLDYMLTFSPHTE